MVISKVNRGKIREAAGDKAFLTFIYVMLSLILIVVLYPMIYVVSSSFSSSRAVAAGDVWLFPVEFTLLGYTTVFTHPNIMNGFLNSVFYTLFGTLTNVFLTILLAYPLSRRQFYGRKFIMLSLIHI